MYENAKRELIGTCIEMERCELVRLSGGNASVRVAHDRFVVTPSGMRYGSLDTDDIVVVDGGGAVIEGSRRPSVDTEALLYIYRSLPKVNAILHTHQPRATTIGVVMDRMPAVFTTLVNAVLGDFPWAASANTAMLTVVMVDVWIFTPFVLPRVVRHLAPRLRHRDDARRTGNPPADVAGARPVARGPKASGVARLERCRYACPTIRFPA